MRMISLYQRSQEEWRTVFYVCAGFDVLGALVFGFFSSGELQTWAQDTQEDKIETAEHIEYNVTMEKKTTTESKDTIF